MAGARPPWGDGNPLDVPGVNDANVAEWKQNARLVQEVRRLATAWAGAVKKVEASGRTAAHKLSEDDWFKLTQGNVTLAELYLCVAKVLNHEYPDPADILNNFEPAMKAVWAKHGMKDGLKGAHTHQMTLCNAQQKEVEKAWEDFQKSANVKKKIEAFVELYNKYLLLAKPRAEPKTAEEMLKYFWSRETTKIVTNARARISLWTALLQLMALEMAEDQVLKGLVIDTRFQDAMVAARYDVKRALKNVLDALEKAKEPSKEGQAEQEKAKALLAEIETKQAELKRREEAKKAPAPAPAKPQGFTFGGGDSNAPAKPFAFGPGPGSGPSPPQSNPAAEARAAANQEGSDTDVSKDDDVEGDETDDMEGDDDEEARHLNLLILDFDGTMTITMYKKNDKIVEAVSDNTRHFQEMTEQEHMQNFGGLEQVVLMDELFKELQEVFGVDLRILS